MSLSREVHMQRKCKPVKCSRHFNQNGLVSDRIYNNNTVTSECNTSKCQGSSFFFTFFFCLFILCLVFAIWNPNAIDFSLSGWIPARLVLYFLSWSGFLVSFMMRNDINIALVSMVRGNNDTILQSIVNGSDTKVPIAVDNGEFDWSSSVQSVILGSFYACYVLSQVNLYDDLWSKLHFNFSLTSTRK